MYHIIRTIRTMYDKTIARRERGEEEREKRCTKNKTMTKMMFLDSENRGKLNLLSIFGAPLLLIRIYIIK